jgi:hypothetical protein
MSAEIVLPSTETFTAPTLAVEMVEPAEPDVETLEAATVATPARVVPALESEIVPPVDGSGPVSATATTVGVMSGAAILTFAAVAWPWYVCALTAVTATNRKTKKGASLDAAPTRIDFDFFIWEVASAGVSE